MRVKLQETPQELWRRVANKLESIRGTPMALGSDEARLGDAACPVYRPDIKGIAYWEFEIAGLKEVRSRGHAGQSSGVGFMLAATGAHDLPIAHWSLTMEPPSRALEAKARDGKVARVVKLDTLTYVAEDEKGKYLGHVGTFPSQVVTVATDLTKLRGISSFTAAPKSPSKDDTAPGEMAVTPGGVKVPRAKLVPFDTWPGTKRGYGKAFRPHLDALAASVKPAWAIEDLIAKFGEGILEGQALTVPLLKPGKAQINGDGAKFVKMTVIDRQPPAVRLEAMPSDEKKELNFQLVLSYEDATSETLLFFIVPKGTPTNNRSVLPHLIATPQGGITP